MAISDQLTLLNNTKTAIRTAINNKGGSVTDSTPFADYSTAIDNLPSGGSGNPILTSIDVSDFTGTTFNASSTYITNVTIPSGVRTLGNNALYNLNNVTSITIPNTVTSIGNNAFSYSGIRSITIPNSVTTIGNNAFQGCNSLTSATLGSGITTLSNSLFSSCGHLRNVTIPNTVTSIGEQVFMTNYELKQVTLPSNLTSIGAQSFNGCSSLRSITIPNSVTTIGNYAFIVCRALTKIIVEPTTPPTLGTDGFRDSTCPIYVPAESVDTYKATSGWSNYASRIYPIQQVATVDGNPVYNYDLRMTSTDTITSENMAKMPAGTSVEFAEGLTNISAGEINYQQVTLPSTFTGFGDSNMIGSSVTTITSNAVTPPSAFKNRLGGSGLTAVYVPASAVDTYKAHAAWGTFSSIIQAIPTE